MTELPNPWISVSPGVSVSPLPSGEVGPSVTLVSAPGEAAPLRGDRQTVVVSSANSPGVAAVTNSACSSRDESLPLASREPRCDLSGISQQERPLADLDMQYIPELFSVYAARRCKDLISPPLPKVERNIDALMLNAVGAALNLHPRDLDDDPPPLFLRKPRPAFLRALFELGGAR